MSPGDRNMADKRKWRVIAGRVAIVLIVIFVILQFIRPPRNLSVGNSPSAIQTRFPVPSNVHEILKRSCYDCHSNNTVYPWYSYVEPVGWFLNSDITEGKGELNFDEFASYPAFRQIRKFAAIREELEEGKMPLPAYTLIHLSAILSPEQKGVIMHWAEAMQDTIKARYPADSLKRPPWNHSQ
jgi:hypothetical protein